MDANAHITTSRSRDPPLGTNPCQHESSPVVAGEFGEGSMHPKVEACLRYIEQGGERAVITSPEHLMDALAGETGARVRA